MCCKEVPDVKRRIFCLAAALLVLLALCAPVLGADGETQYIYDFAGLLSADEAASLEQNARQVSEWYGCGVYVVTVDDYQQYYGASDIEQFAEDVFTDLSFGLGAEQNGILLALSMEDRDYDLCAHGDLANYAFTDYGKGALAERWFLDAFGQDDWAAGMQRYLDGCKAFLQQAADGTPFDKGTDPERLEDIRIGKGITVVFVPLLTALIVCLILRGKMKTARVQTHANAYIKADGVHMCEQTDRFLTVTQTRVKVATSNSGGTTVNSGGFSHSSGKF